MPDNGPVDRRYLADDFMPEGFAVVRGDTGRAAFLPFAARRLKGEALDVFTTMQRGGIIISEIEHDLHHMAHEARELGLSWSLIGAAVGLTGEGARRRYGPNPDDE